MKDSRTIESGTVLARLVLALSMVGAAAALQACNTTEGVGKDVKSLGKGIEETAEDAKN